MPFNDADLLKKIKDIAKKLDGLGFIMVVIDPESTEAQQFSNLPPDISKRILIDACERQDGLEIEVHPLKGH